ncbi:hypothetical protein Q5H91_10450 [Sphingomonas sp. KR1UV-12]|uniref:Uncharacterized protein n=1 Tax=Sphingomonas aurea TaxID=3063994 RepID=A0ABT9EL20_9SPHN|nr:hypothetical protein [Sphingomonas sp. KR1UV-12]MDP1027634.1 hypothetical protein [Sphingomonas sp. KR1UV-12]
MATKQKPARRSRSAKPAAKPARSKTFGVNLLTAGAAAIGLGATAVAILFARRGARANPAEHAAPDLALDQPRPGAQDRAPDAFRPDPTAPVPASLRESLRPATGPAPSLAADRGTTIQ